jgi:hypothetical protein
VLLAGVAVLLCLLYVGTANGGFPLDDAWIHQVYGRNLALTGQWAFVPGVPSAASTSPLYTVLLAVGYRLGVPFALWTHGLGALALTITALVGARLAERLLPGVRGVGLAAGLALATSWHLVWAAASGMETMLFGMWMLVLVNLTHTPLGGYGTPVSLQHAFVQGVRFGVLAALATFTRPEGIVLAGMIGLAMLLVRPQGTWRGFAAWALGVALAFGVVIAPYLALNLQLTGGLLPDTAAAKQTQFAALLELPYVTRVLRLLTPLSAGGQLLLVPGAVVLGFVLINALLFGKKNSGNAVGTGYIPSLRILRWDVLFDLLPLAWAGVLVLLYAARLPTDYQHGRYVIPALPAFIVLGVAGTARLLTISRGLLPRVLSRTLAVSAGLAFVYFALLAGPMVYRQDVSIIDQEMVRAAHWIADNIPPQETLAVHDIGALGYFAPRPILDLAGLVNPEIIPFINDAEPLWAWLQQNGARYLMAFPDQIPGDDPRDPRLCAVFMTGGTASPAAGGPNMTVYALAWDGSC